VISSVRWHLQGLRPKSGQLKATALNNSMNLLPGPISNPYPNVQSKMAGRLTLSKNALCATFWKDGRSHGKSIPTVHHWVVGKKCCFFKGSPICPQTFVQILMEGRPHICVLLSFHRDHTSEHSNQQLSSRNESPNSVTVGLLVSALKRSDTW